MSVFWAHSLGNCSYGLIAIFIIYFQSLEAEFLWKGNVFEECRTIWYPDPGQAFHFWGLVRFPDLRNLIHKIYRTFVHDWLNLSTCIVQISCWYKLTGVLNVMCIRCNPRLHSWCKPNSKQPNIQNLWPWRTNSFYEIYNLKKSLWTQEHKCHKQSRDCKKAILKYKVFQWVCFLSILVSKMCWLRVFLNCTWLWEKGEF